MNVALERVETLEFPLTEASNYYLVRIGDLEIAVDAGAKPGLPRPPSSGWVLVTHWHWDHVMGLAGSRGFNVCMSKKTYNILFNYYKKYFNEILRALGLEDDREAMTVAEIFNKRYETVTEALERSHNVYFLEEPCSIIEKLGAKAIECPGHSRDHVCYIIGDELFPGDTILPNTRPTIIDFRAYRQSILKVLLEKWSIIRPGHGGPIRREDAFKTLLRSTIERCNRTYIILSKITKKGRVALDSLLREVYGVEPSISSFIQARTLVGYLAELEKTGLIRIEKRESPWLIEYVTDSSTGEASASSC